MSAIFTIPATAAIAALAMLLVGYRLRAAGRGAAPRRNAGRAPDAGMFWLGTMLLIGAGVAAAVCVIALAQLSTLSRPV
jgi:hypothetical protein